MKNIPWKVILGLAALFFIGIVSCSKPKPPVKIVLTPLQTLVNTDTSLSFFHRLLLQGNDAGLLADESVSLLIPTNQAFRSAGYTADTVIDTLPAFYADRMLRYGYITSSISADTSYTGYPTLLGTPIYILLDKSGRLLFNTGATAAVPGTAVGKATVYFLDAPLSPPLADSLPDFLIGDTSLSYLAEAFYRTNLYDSLLQPGGYTLLTPTNDAFRAIGYDSVSFVDSIGIDSLRQLLINQTIKGLYFVNLFPVPGTVTTLSGFGITVGKSNGLLQFSGPGNPIPVNWISGDQVVAPGLIVHKTDGFVSP
jgi:uncharacterized surface protein with fasciclin (FAS1) repeats